MLSDNLGRLAENGLILAKLIYLKIFPSSTSIPRMIQMMQGLNELVVQVFLIGA